MQNKATIGRFLLRSFLFCCECDAFFCLRFGKLASLGAEFILSIRSIVALFFLPEPVQIISCNILKQLYEAFCGMVQRFASLFRGCQGCVAESSGRV